MPELCREETVKAVLENMDGSLKEMKNQVGRIQDAVYLGEHQVQTCGQLYQNVKNEPMLVIMHRQRDEAEEILKDITELISRLW